MRELKDEELAMVAGGQTAIQAWALKLPEFPNSKPHTWQRAFDNFEDRLEVHPDYNTGLDGMLNYGDGALGQASVTGSSTFPILLRRKEMRIVGTLAFFVFMYLATGAYATADGWNSDNSNNGGWGNANSGGSGSSGGYYNDSGQ